MVKFFHLKLLFLIVTLLFGCKAKIPQSDDIKLRQIENEDIVLCNSLKINFNNNETFLKNDIFWRCRINLAQERIIEKVEKNEEIHHNILINNIIKNLQKNLQKNYEENGNDKNILFDENDHLYCSIMGFNFISKNQAKIEDYLSCRRRIIGALKAIPPYENKIYFSNQNNELKKPQKIDEKIAKEAKTKFNFCSEFYLNENDFNDCARDYIWHRQCIAKIEPARILHILQEKITCQKKAYLAFGDDLLKENNQLKEEIEKFNNQVDYSEKNTLASLGFGPEAIDKFQFKDKKNEKKNKKTEKNINNKKNLYNKVELAKLRQRFIILCDQESDPKTATFVETLSKNCSSIMSKWETKLKNPQLPQTQ